jgi:hypothetical protein
VSAHNRIRWEGLDELRAELRKLPDELAAEGTTIVVAHATRAHAAIDAVYAQHEHTGFLRRALQLSTQAAGRFGAGMLLINRAPHAWMFEHGTKVRHNGIGNRGAMKATPTFIPIVMRERHAMYDALANMLKRVTGFQVTGRAA